MGIGSVVPPLLANPPSFTHNSPANASGGFMFAVRSRKFQLSLLLAMALLVSIGPAAGQAYSPEQEQACTPDAMRLCGAYIPDVDQITVCMIQKKSQLSPECRAYFRPEPAATVSPVAAGRPLSIRPATARKPVSVVKRRPKKPAKPSAT